jgi:hypothetical protein
MASDKLSGLHQLFVTDRYYKLYMQCNIEISYVIISKAYNYNRRAKGELVNNIPQNVCP